MVSKLKQALAVAVRAVAIERHHLGPHRHSFFIQFERFGALDEPPADGAGSLIAHNKQSRFWVGQHNPLVPHDAPAARHAGARQNYFRSGSLMNFTRRINSLYKPQLGELEVEFRKIVRKNGGYFLSKWRVYKHRHRRDALLHHQGAYFVHEVLRALGGKS